MLAQRQFYTQFKTFCISFFIICLTLYILQKSFYQPYGEISVTDIALESLKGYSQSDTKLLDYIREHHLREPQTGPYNLTPTDPYPNTIWTDLVSAYVAQLLNYKREGFFIECGANDGEFLSNTLSLELKYGWSGLLVEADPDPLKVLLTRNRKAWIANACLATESYPHMVEMLRHKNMNGVSYIKKYLDGRSSSDYSIQFKATCFPIFSILSALKVTEVDYFSLDIEGAELAVLKTFPFDGPILIKIISAEVHPGKDEDLKEFLATKGYRVAKYIEASYVQDLIFVHKSLPDLKE